MVNLLSRNVKIIPNQYKEEPIDIGDVSSIQSNNETFEQANNPTIYKGHWFWSKLYPLLCFILVLIKIVSGVSFFHQQPFVTIPSPFQLTSQRFGLGLMAWSLNCYFVLPYVSNKNQTREAISVWFSTFFIIGSVLDIFGIMMFFVYSIEFNASNQLFDLLFLPDYKKYRSFLIASTIFFDFAIALIYVKHIDISTYDPKKDNNRYKLGSFTGYIRDNIYSKNRLDIIHSSCFQIVIRNRGATAVKFGDASCTDPTFRSVTSFKVERIVTRVKRILFIFPYKTREKVDFSVRILKAIPPGEDIIFVPGTHQVTGAYRIEGLRSFGTDRGDEVETRITLPYDRFPFLTRIEQYIPSTAERRRDYESSAIQLTHDQNSDCTVK